MKTLVVYYSRTGNTRKVAEALAGKLGADIEELKEDINRRGFIGYLTAGRDGMLKRKTRINPLSNNPSDYDLVLVGGPIWGFNLAPPLRTFLSEFKGKLKQTAFFCTMGGSGDTRTFIEMEKECGLTPKKNLSVTEKEVADCSYQDACKAFSKRLK